VLRSRRQLLCAGIDSWRSGTSRARWRRAHAEWARGGTLLSGSLWAHPPPPTARHHHRLVWRRGLTFFLMPVARQTNRIVSTDHHRPYPARESDNKDGSWLRRHVASKATGQPYDPLGREGRTRGKRPATAIGCRRPLLGLVGLHTRHRGKIKTKKTRNKYVENQTRGNNQHDRAKRISRRRSSRRTSTEGSPWPRGGGASRRRRRRSIPAAPRHDGITYFLDRAKETKKSG